MPSLEETLRQLGQARDHADREYNEALTALDQSLGPPADVGDPPAPFDDQQITALNGAWNILGTPPPTASGMRGRLAAFVWRVVSPALERQVTFNSWLTDHLNRNVAAAHDAHRHAREAAAALRAQAAALAHTQTRLIGYLQQITLYVDTRDRLAAGGALVLNAALSGMADDVAKRAESAAARDRRLDARLDALTTTDEELRASLGILQQSSAMLKRELARMAVPGATPAAARVAEQSSTPSPRADSEPSLTTSPASNSSAQVFAPTLDAYKYVAFEDRFRGSRDVIRARLESYLPFFQGTSDVLDVGCGRGEFLELLAQAGVSARGIDLNHEMAESCQARGLDVSHADVVSYLTTLPDGALGGLFAAQVVEHLQPADLLSFLELACQKLRPGGRIVLETLNPACWVAFFESYIRDITHVWPLHPETLQFLVLASGFSRAKIEFRSPVAPGDRLQRLEVPAGAEGALADIAETFNANVETLNGRMFTFLDYAIIGGR